MTDAPAIKQNANGIWMLEGEQLWDSDILPVCLDHIKEDDTVIDAGAWIGGHAMAYAKKVGVMGKVMAFEPNPFAVDCVNRNTERFDNVKTFQVALGDKLQTVSLSGKRGWYDSAHVSEEVDELVVNFVMMTPLDDYNLAPNFIKIDVEGCELKVLKGAAKTIEKYRPVIVFEINRPALERQGNTPHEVIDWIIRKRYQSLIIEKGVNWSAEIYNVLARPIPK